MTTRFIIALIIYLAGMLLFSYTYARWEVCGTDVEGSAAKAKADRIGITVCAVLWPLTAPFATSCVLAERGQKRNQP